MLLKNKWNRTCFVADFSVGEAVGKKPSDALFHAHNQISLDQSKLENKKFNSIQKRQTK